MAIIVNAGGLPAGTTFSDKLFLTEHVPQGHKVALTDFVQGQSIIRYGEVIGQAARPIRRGDWIEESLVELPSAPALDELPLADHVPAPLPPLAGYTFDGYRNSDGTVGVKNILGISSSVQCVAGVLDYELSLECGVELDPRTQGALVDENCQTSVEGVFAAGNVLHVHDLVDFATLEAEALADSVAEYIQAGGLPACGIDITTNSNVIYTVPQKISGKQDCMLSMRVRKPLKNCRLEILQQKAVLKTLPLKKPSRLKCFEFGWKKSLYNQQRSLR